jgi:carbamoyltransferase
VNVLGLNAFHGDSAAALLKDGAFQAGIEEERLNRIKHWAGFPAQAVRSVLDQRQIRLDDVEHVAISRDPTAHLLEKALFAFRNRPGLGALRSRLGNMKRVAGVEDLLSLRAGDRGTFRGSVHHVEHHRAHIASAFFCSPFEEAACLTVDGFGDFLSSMSALGRGNRIEVLDEVSFPHSLGIFYTAITQFLGFPKYGDEYKVMGLAAYGQPTLLPKLRQVLRLTDEGRFELDLDFFRHTSDGVTMSWDDGEPTIGPLWSSRLEGLFGPARANNADIVDRDRDLASSLQAMYEEAFFHRVNWLQRRTGLSALCLAGGCAMNSVANGKLFRRSGFRDVFIQSAAGDAGTALGAALYAWHSDLGKRREFVMEHSYWGPESSDAEVLQAIKRAIPGFDAAGLAHPARVGDLVIEQVHDDQELYRSTAAAIARGEIVGWYQGRSEWGPRALGNRSILADPRRPEMKDVLNARIKRREPFRPFAPSILEERVSDYFEESYPDPFMIKVYPIRTSKRAEIPAVTHADGTGRLQTVSKTQNPRYWGLINAFGRETGVPLVLNTSFNENEPIVNTPAEALACFLRTRMHRLVQGHWVLSRAYSNAR